MNRAPTTNKLSFAFLSAAQHTASSLDGLPAQRLQDRRARDGWTLAIPQHHPL